MAVYTNDKETMPASLWDYASINRLCFSGFIRKNKAHSMAEVAHLLLCGYHNWHLGSVSNSTLIWGIYMHVNLTTSLAYTDFPYMHCKLDALCWANMKGPSQRITLRLTQVYEKCLSASIKLLQQLSSLAVHPLPLFTREGSWLGRY